MCISGMLVADRTPDANSIQKNLIHLVRFLPALLSKSKAFFVLHLWLWYDHAAEVGAATLARCSATSRHYGSATGLTVRSRPSPISGTGRSSLALPINPDRA
jgi:hypothetical protein